MTNNHTPKTVVCEKNALESLYANVSQELEQLLADLGLSDGWSRARDMLGMLPLSTSEYAMALNRLDNAQQYVAEGQSGAARFELRLLARRFASPGKTFFIAAHDNLAGISTIGATTKRGTVSKPHPGVAERRPPAGLEGAAPWEPWRQSPAEDQLPEGTAEDRIRRVFHLGATDPLRLVRQNTLRVYYAHLARFLAFPFRASHCDEMEPLVLDGCVIATGLCDPAQTPLDSAKGILCNVVFRNAVRLPLALLKVDPQDPNSQMIDDYWHWFWNCR